MKNSHTKNYSFPGISMLIMASVLLTGCNSEPKRVEADYGNSVTQMVQAATYDPEAAASTESIPVIGMDGKRSISTLDALQSDTERVEKFENMIDIQLGE